MDERPIDKEAAEEIYKLFEARPLDPKQTAAVNNVQVTEDKVLARTFPETAVEFEMRNL